MRAAFYDSLDTTISRRVASLGVRTAYLLADNVLWCGNSAGLYDVAGLGSSLSTERKLEALETLVDDERVEIIQNFKKTLKAMKKIKNKPANGIALQSRMIHSIDKLYDDHIGLVFSSFHRLGFPKLNGEMLKEKVIDLYKLSDADTESDANGCTPLSIILQGMPDEGQLRPDVPLLPDVFLAMDYVKEKLVPSAQPGAADAGTIHVHKAFSLPNLSKISETEMQVLRRQTADAATQFRIVMDEWSEICTETNEPEERLAFFRRRVVPECNSLQAAFSAHDIIKGCYREQQNDIKYNVWIGEVPVPLLFRFQHDWGIMDDNTLQVLENWMQEDGQTEARWPMMAMECHGIDDEDEDEDQKEEEQLPVLQKKKSLSVD